MIFIIVLAAVMTKQTRLGVRKFIVLWPWQMSPSFSFSLIRALRSRHLPGFNLVFKFLMLKTSSYGARGSTVSSSTGSGGTEIDENDLTQLESYIEETDGGPPWQPLMKRSTATLTYEAWYRDPQSGPTQYRTRTVFHNISPELVKDFFWDDQFRPKWDDMLRYSRTLYFCPQTGTMIVHWIRKLPVFFGEREYIIARRLWQSESTYYCITKGTEHPSLPKSKKLRRVDHYYSSWHVRPDGRQQGATEVLLFHHEDIGMPRELIKIGVRTGMWGIVKRLDAGVQDYKTVRLRASGAFPSSHAS